jgi:hypothetical protein
MEAQQDFKELFELFNGQSAAKKISQTLNLLAKNNLKKSRAA